MESKKEVYPINSTARQYHDADGNPTTLYRLVREEPDWAMSRIKAGEQAIAQRDELLAALKRISAWNEHTVKFAVDHGSNGVRDLYRSIADETIAKCEVKS